MAKSKKRREPRQRKNKYAEHSKAGQADPADDALQRAEIGAAPALDLHGLSVEEAEIAVDQFLAQLVLAGEDAAKIIHGRGEGKLRSAVRSLLDRHKTVERFRDSFAGDAAVVVALPVNPRSP